MKPLQKQPSSINHFNSQQTRRQKSAHSFRLLTIHFKEQIFPSSNCASHADILQYGFRNEKLFKWMSKYLTSEWATKSNPAAEGPFRDKTPKKPDNRKCKCYEEYQLATSQT